MPNLPTSAISHLLKVLERILEGVALAAIFVTAAVLGFFWHVDLPAGRRLVAQNLSFLLSDALQGKLEIGRIVEMGPYTLLAEDIIVLDPTGQRVLQVYQLRGQFNLIDLLYRVATNEDELSISVPYARIERADAWIVPDPETGIPTIAAAFTPTPSEKPPTEQTPGPKVRVHLPNIEIGSLYARGRPAAGVPTLEVELSNLKGSVLASEEEAAVDIAGFAMKARGIGGADAEGIARLQVRSPGGVWGSFDGYFGPLQVDARVHNEGDSVAIVVDIPRAKPEEAKALWPDWPLHESVSARAEAHGVMPTLDVSVLARTEHSELGATGKLDLGTPLQVDLEVNGRHLDLRALDPEAPRTTIDAQGRLQLSAAEELRGTLAARIEPTLIEGELVPRSEALLSFGPEGIVVDGRVHEPGMPLNARIELPPSGVISFSGRTDPFSLQRAPRLREYLDARGQAQLEVRGSIEQGRLNARVQGDVTGFGIEGIELEQGKVQGSIRGKLDELDRLGIDARVTGQGLSGQGLRFDQLEASVKGPATRPKVDAKLTDRYGPTVVASATVAADAGGRIQELELDISRRGAKLQGRVTQVEVGADRIVIEGLSMRGAGGTLDANVRVTEHEVRIDSQGRNVDLDALSRLLGLPRGDIAGRLNIDADVVATSERQTGHIHVALGDAALGPITGIALRLNALVDGMQLRGDVSAQVRDYGDLGAVFNSQLAGPLTQARSWRRMTGAAQVQLGALRLARANIALPKDGFLKQVRGYGYGQLRVERSKPEGLPDLFLVAATEDLEVFSKPLAEGDGPLYLSDIDVQLGGTIAGSTGELTGTARLVDDVGAIASTSGTLQVNLAQIFTDPDSLSAQLESAPLDAVFSLEERPFAMFPKPIRPAGVVGILGGRLAVSGTVSEPSFRASAHLQHFRSANSRYVLPVDVRANGLFEKTSGRFRASAEAQQNGRRVALAVAEGTARWGDLTGQVETPEPALSGGANVLLEGLPLAVFAPLADAEVNGELYGNVSVQRSGRLPQVAADVEVRGASIQDVKIGAGRLGVRSDGQSVGARMRFVDEDGDLELTALAPVTWDGVMPTLDASKAVELGLEARQFDAVVLSPVLSDVLSEITGNIDANLDARLTAQNPDDLANVEWTADIRGSAQMRGGKLQLATLGMQLNDVDFDAIARESDGGLTEIAIDNVRARSRSESHNIKARANLYLDGLVVRRGNADIRLEQPVPILIEGVSQASATGRATAIMVRREDKMEVTIEIPQLQAKLPRASARSVIPLEANESIRILQPIEKPEDSEDAGDILPWEVTFELGRDVKITRADLNLPITGSPVMRLAEETQISGEIELQPGGRVELVGKVFVIENGFVRFDTGDPSNPHVYVTASWRAPNGIIVYVDVRGTFEQGTLSLRSEPPVGDETQLQALLLGGASAEGEASPESTGIGLGAGLLQDLLADTPLGAVEVRTASESTAVTGAYSTITAAVPISDEVWFEGSYKRAETAPVDGQETAFSGTIDWRFRRNWSLRTEIGQLGTNMDLLWRYRY